MRFDDVKPLSKCIRCGTDHSHQTADLCRKCRTAKHTPGPWQVEPRTENGTYYVSIPRKDGTIFTSSWVAQVGPFNDEDEANARLVAAAPELLEACEDMVALLARELPTDLGVPAAARARAAIAKASRQAT